MVRIHTHWHTQRNNISNPITTTITTSITTITRKSVGMVAELSNDTAPSRIPDTTDCLEDYSAVIALKPPSEFGAYAVVGWMQWFGVPMLAGSPAAVYQATSLKEVHRMPGRQIGESPDRLGNPTFRLALQTQEQHIRLDEDQLTTGTADLKMTEDALADSST